MPAATSANRNVPSAALTTLAADASAGQQLDRGAGDDLPGRIDDRPLQEDPRRAARNCNEENEKTDEDGATEDPHVHSSNWLARS